MNPLKKILFPLFSVFLCYQTVAIMKILLASEPSDLSTLQHFIIPFLFPLFITGIFAFIGFAYPSHKILPSSYYTIKNPKRLNYISKILGIKYFKFLLLFAFWGKEKNRKKYFNGTKQGLKNFVFQTKQSEFGHIAALIVILILSIILQMHGYFFLVGIITVINILGNLYPVILQRTHRIRIINITRNIKE
ncbi:MAG: hypothetical protein KBT69_08950 [Oceanihabitans sp.]|nr:hypothetical protein [Oceanihabitans sp.]